MYIVTSKKDNIVINFGELIEYQSNGYPKLINEDVAFPNNFVNIHEVNIMPKDIQSVKYCYTEQDSFYLNPNWKDTNNPYGIPNETYEEIRQDIVNEIVEGVKTNGEQTEPTA